MKRSKAPTLDEVRELVEKHWAEWCVSHGTEEAIRDRIDRMLDKATQQIVCSLLGFNRDSWGNWRIDHCNNRSGNSVIGDYLREKAGKAVTAWIDKQAELPEIPKTALADVKKEYLAMYNDRLRRRLRELAEHRAERKAVEMLEALERESSEPAETDKDGE